MKNPDLITILGPTATGKTRLAAQLADHFNGEIISADSRQVYRGMDIGTGKDLDEYSVSGRQVAYHLIDIIDPAEEFDLFRFQFHFYKIFSEILSRKKLPFLTGGTGLYLSSVLQNYNLNEVDFEAEKQRYDYLSDEELRNLLRKLNTGLHNTTDLIERERIIKAIAVAKSGKNRTEKRTAESLTIGVYLPRDEIKKRITARLKKRLDEEGMIEEVKSLMNSGISYEKMIYFGLEYRFIARYLSGKINKNDMFQKLNSAIYSFAKRQMTWFRKMEKEGVPIRWIEGPDFEIAKELIEQNFFKNASA